jgi:hypothetical protein
MTPTARAPSSTSSPRSSAHAVEGSAEHAAPARPAASASPATPLGIRRPTRASLQRTRPAHRSWRSTGAVHALPSSPLGAGGSRAGPSPARRAGHRVSRCAKRSGLRRHTKAPAADELRASASTRFCSTPHSRSSTSSTLDSDCCWSSVALVSGAGLDAPPFHREPAACWFMLGVARPLSLRARVRDGDVVVAPDATHSDDFDADVSHQRCHEELSWSFEPG